MKIVTLAPHRNVVTDIAGGQMTARNTSWVFGEAVRAEVKDANGKTYAVAFTVEELEELLRVAKGETP